VNKRRLEESDPAVRRKNLAELSHAAADPVRARQFLLKSAMIAMQRRAQSITFEEA
jgi:3-(3-hydroxy-phenyl)propionate hydroxylase